ncbi:hypothetical protein K438DRAFT_1758127 [Mycena galopus ATCC 62051]|nr:hypothetical protein K438DRAFT_1758127 [Mycena galopus ATCC 62051]
MPRSNLQHLRDRLALLNSQIPLLEAERKTIRQKLAAVFYPVLELPTEITSEIFVHCLLNVPLTPTALTAPLLLLRICKKWREIALKTPVLWASFAVHDVLRERQQGPLRGNLGISRLLEWLQRAGAAPLDLDLTYKARLSPLRSKKRTIHRVFSPALRTGFSHPRAQASLRENVTSLEELSLDVNDQGKSKGWRCASDTGPLTVFTKAPKLRTVSLISLPLSNIVLPWAQLTSLTTEGFTVGEVLEVLHFCPNLTYLYLSCPSEPGTGLAQSLASRPAPTLPNLKTLLLDNQHYDFLFDHLTLPGLTSAFLCTPNTFWLSSPDRPRMACGNFIFVESSIPDMLDDVFPNDIADVMELLSESPAAVHLHSIRLHVTVDRESPFDNPSVNYTKLLRILVIFEKKALRSFHMACAIPNFCDYVCDYPDDYSDPEEWVSRHERRYMDAIRPDANCMQQLSKFLQRNDAVSIFLASTKERWI